MSIRKVRAWATLLAGILIVVLALIVEVLTMPKYNGYDLPELPASEYQNAYIAVSGNTAYLYFVNKKGYIEVDPNGLGNTYTLGLTTTDPYDESKILFAEKYVATIGGDSWTAEELPDLSGVYDIPAYAQFSLPCEIGGPVWSNVTLLDQDGNVFIEGTAPVKNFDRKSFIIGYLTALCGPVVSFPEKQPTAYSYNGVVLPGLPKLPEGYKFKYVQTTLGLYRAIFSSKPLGIRYNDSGNIVAVGSAGETVAWVEYKFNTESNAWETYREKDGVMNATMHRPVWANTDMPVYVLNDDGETFSATGEIGLVASEPVPVYE